MSQILISEHKLIIDRLKTKLKNDIKIFQHYLKVTENSKNKLSSIAFRDLFEEELSGITTIKLKIEKLQLQLDNIQYTSLLLSPQKSFKHRMNNRLILLASFIFGIIISLIPIFIIYFKSRTNKNSDDK